MWQLSMRDRNKNWTELGTFDGIGLAARRVLELEHPDQPIGSLFFQVHADPLVHQSDAEILARLEYRAARSRLYVLTRRMQ
jgi:hypothetical protein